MHTGHANIDSQPSTAPVSYWALLRSNSSYRRLWLGLTASMAGDWLRTIALYHLVLQLTGASSLALGGIMIAQTFSLFLLSPIAGVVADRLNRKAVMISTDLVRTILALGFLLIRSPDQVWLAYALTATLTAVSAFFHPAYAATLPNITSRRQLVAANALSSASWAAMLALGAALGGVIVSSFGTAAAFLLDAATYGLSAWCITTVTIPRQQPDTSQEAYSGWREFWHGMRYMTAHCRLRRLLTVKACSGGLSGGLLILFAVYAEEIFHAGAMGMGNLYMARGLGAILGPLLARRLVGETPPMMYRSLGGAFLIAAGLYIVFAGMPTLWWAAAALCLATMASNVLWVFSSTLLQIETPDVYRGRVFAADFALLTIMMALSSFVTGWGLDYAAIAPRVMTAGLGGILVLPGLYWLLATRRRRQQPVMRFSFVEAGEAIRE